MRTAVKNLGKIEGIQLFGQVGKIHIRTRPDLFPGSGWAWRLTGSWLTAYKSKPRAHRHLSRPESITIRHMPPKAATTIRTVAVAGAAMTRVMATMVWRSHGPGSLRSTGVVGGGDVGGRTDIGMDLDRFTLQNRSKSPPVWRAVAVILSGTVDPIVRVNCPVGQTRVKIRAECGCPGQVRVVVVARKSQSRHHHHHSNHHRLIEL